MTIRIPRLLTAALSVAAGPADESRRGNSDKISPLGSTKSLLKHFNNVIPGLMVQPNSKGELVVTAGNHYPYPYKSYTQLPSGLGSSQQGIHTTGMGWASPNASRPGAPVYTHTHARHFYSVFFKLLLDPKTLKPIKTTLPKAEVDQIKDYIETISESAQATNQFAIGKTQYYGYYDKKSRSYVVDEINLDQQQFLRSGSPGRRQNFGGN